MGMQVEIKMFANPQHSPNLDYMIVVGCVEAQDLARFKDYCLSISPPKLQITLGNRRIHPKEPLRTCQEWVVEVIEASTLSGIVNPLESR